MPAHDISLGRRREENFADHVAFMVRRIHVFAIPARRKHQLRTYAVQAVRIHEGLIGEVVPH